jgi:lia operon protein LiaG
MKNHMNFTPILLLMLFMAAPNQGFAQMSTLVDVEKTFSGITRVEVSGGSLEIEYIGGQGNEIAVKAFLESTYQDQDILFVTIGDVLKISHKVNNTNKSWGNQRTKGHIRIQGPSQMDLEMKGGSGSVRIENVSNAQTNIAVGSGSVHARNIKGNLTANAGSGSLKLSDIHGDVKGRVGSGSALIEDLKGNLDYSSGSGGVIANRIAGVVNITVTSGYVKVNDVAELGDLKVTSGNFNAQNAGLGSKTKISGTSGNFRIQTNSQINDFNYSLNATSGNVTVGNSRGGKNLQINNNSATNIRGSITSGNISISN